MQRKELEVVSTKTVGLFISDKVSGICASSCKNNIPEIKTLISESKTSNDEIRNFLNKLLEKQNHSEAISFIVFYEATDAKKENHVESSVKLDKRIYSNPNLTLMKLNDGLPDLDHYFKKEKKEILELFPIKKMIDYDSDDDANTWLPFIIKSKSLEYYKGIIQKNEIFFRQLDSLATKVESLKKENSKIASAASDLKKILEETWNNFYLNQINFETFKNTCDKAIKSAEPKFKDDLSLKTILINIGLAILGLGVFYLAALKITGNTLFFDTRKTYLINERAQLQQTVDNLGFDFAPKQSSRI